MGKAHWNAVMCQYLHSHWESMWLRNPNASCKSCWMLCIFCSSSYCAACFQFVPLVRHQSAYFDTLSGIFRKCDSANAFWTRYLETAIGWRFRIVQKSAQMSYMAGFVIVPPKQLYGQICQRLIFTVELARWWRTCENPEKKVIQQWIIIQSFKPMHPTTANLPIAHTVRVCLPQIGNCYITNWYSLSYRFRLLDVEMKSVFKASF